MSAGRVLDMVKHDAVRIYRERLLEKLHRMRFDESEGDEAARAYRKAWNHAIDNVIREVG